MVKPIGMNKYIIFDNGGITLDRFTIVHRETGDVFAASENPARPAGIGSWIGNCAAHRTILNGCGWRQRQPSGKVIKAETENYINNARLDPKWIGREIDIKTLPESVKEFIFNLDSENPQADHPSGQPQTSRELSSFPGFRAERTAQHGTTPPAAQSHPPASMQMAG